MCLKVNPDKTEHTLLKRTEEDEEEWRKVKKLVTLLGDKEELARRKGLTSQTLIKASNLWPRRAIVSEQRGLRIYNACVKPILTYNMGSWALSSNETAKLDRFHRKQLKRVLGIHYSDRISNKDLYARTRSVQISEEMLGAIWLLLGNVLRMPDEVPA